MKKNKKFTEMTAAELAEATREFDKEHTGPGLPGKPLNARERRIHRKAKMGRPVIGAGAERLTVTVERGLLKEAKAYAKRNKMKRSELVAAGLRLVMQQKVPTTKAG